MATGVPQYHRLAAQGVLPGVAPALVPETTDGRSSWAGGGPLPTRRPRAEQPVAAAGYDTVTVSMRHGLEAVDILRLRRACGAVLQSVTGTTVSFLVPAGTVSGWHLPGSSCSAGAVVLPATDPRWVMPPAGAGAAARPTDPWVLRSALCEAACTLTAGGLGPF
ncbi:hypothetical protein OG689_26510 [Kitasatospora sp. NBC_00240]|uniref:hypothetical protein n=1 Tax=Kitasatospora sp. NBC_00240 TaxID=2903567 RepID=UPI002258D6C2|nr:hypothetical protein [Kitasatospora sp. NBC_00240]MCX5212790.1 hypothetical protein [Kitasatospora sp. NBC_00240]